MIEINDEIAELCIQLRNMIKFLNLSLDSEETISKQDVSDFLSKMSFISDKICKSIKTDK